MDGKDCVRETTSRLKDASYTAGLRYKMPLQGVTAEQCEMSCVSDLGCEIWNFTPDGTCTFLYRAPSIDSQTTVPITGASSGMIGCRKKTDFYKGILWFLLMVLVLVTLWYITQWCRK